MAWDYTYPEGINTPGINFSSNNNVLDIRGKSFPENAGKFYDQIYKTLMEKVDRNSALTVSLYFEYINSSSIICVLKFLKELKGAVETLQINWIYDSEDEELLNVGEDIARVLDTKMNFKGVVEED